MKFSSSRAVLAALLSSVAMLPTAALAQTAPAAEPAIEDAASDNDIIVTAQKREENIQNVPLSILALGEKKLDQLNVTNFQNFTALLPSVSFQSSQPGVTTVYVRGVASGGDGNHSASLPSVG